MRAAIGSDHAGFSLKQELKDFLRELESDVIEHDDMNVLVLGARVIGPEMARELTRAFLAARFTGEARHRRRLAKVAALEARFTIQSPA